MRVKFRVEAGKFTVKKNDNAENYTSLWYCNALESTGVGGHLNIMELKERAQ